MASPLGLRNALKEAALWLGGCGLVFSAVFFSDNITAGLDALQDARQQRFESRERNGDDASVRQRPTDELDSHGDRTGGIDRPNSAASRVVYLRADRYNQFYADSQINGRSIRVLVDTGASHVSLRYEDARAIGIHLSKSDFTHYSQTANGRTPVAPVMLDTISIGDIVVRDVRGYVGAPGKKFVTLLGMAFLKHVDSVSISGREMVLMD